MESYASNRYIIIFTCQSETSQNIYGIIIISQLTLILTNLVHTTTSVHATDVQDSQSHPTSTI